MPTADPEPGNIARQALTVPFSARVLKTPRQAGLPNPQNAVKGRLQPGIRVAWRRNGAVFAGSPFSSGRGETKRLTRFRQVPAAVLGDDFERVQDKNL